MLNFLNSKLLPKISCKTPCTDNYEVENLISDQYPKRIRGFISYPSIKPPVEIEFEFLCNVNIFYLFLNTTVGNHRCSGIEIFAKSPNTLYVSIAKATYDAQGVIFCNSRKYSKESPPSSYNSNFSLNFFKSTTYRTFLNASKLKVVIFRTKKSVPCLSSVEICGVPSKSCSQKTVETLNRLMGYSASQDGVIRVNNSSTDPTNSNNTSNKDNFIIPDDFKDALTYELMTIPYTLPCGKTIDQTTLEKHVESEKSFGRKPCDPFTGNKFGENLKPILNVALKSRIDMFLLENSHRVETYGLKRSLEGLHFQNKRLKRETVGNYSNNDKNLVQNTTENIPHCSNSSSTGGDDLDSLIQKAKSGTNFVSFLNPIKSNENICNLCKNSFQYLYKLPCSHIYCRKCLLEICQTCKCKNCGSTFLKSDVTKCDL